MEAPQPISLPKQGVVRKVPATMLSRWKRLKRHRDVVEIAATLEVNRGAVANAINNGKAQHVLIEAIDKYYTWREEKEKQAA